MVSIVLYRIRERIHIDALLTNQTAVKLQLISIRVICLDVRIVAEDDSVKGVCIVIQTAADAESSGRTEIFNTNFRSIDIHQTAAAVCTAANAGRLTDGTDVQTAAFDVDRAAALADAAADAGALAAGEDLQRSAEIVEFRTIGHMDRCKVAALHVQYAVFGHRQP